MSSKEKAREGDGPGPVRKQRGRVEIEKRRKQGEVGLGKHWVKPMCMKGKKEERERSRRLGR